jgi:hypothetical protein
MIPRIVLFALQIAAGWFIVPILRKSLPGVVPPAYELFLLALLYAVVIIVVGFVGALVMKGVPVPSAGTFVVMLILAGALAALALYVPQFTQAVEGVAPILRANRFVYPFVGALLGYYVKR